MVVVKDVCRQFGRRDKNRRYDARSRYNLTRRLWVISALLVLAVIPAIALVPQAKSDYGDGGGDYGGEKTTTTTSSTTTGMQTTTAQVTSVPEGIDPLLPILLVIGFLSLFHYRRQSGLKSVRASRGKTRITQQELTSER